MLVAVLLSLALLIWSAAANLIVGEHLYVTRNLAFAAVLLALARMRGLGWQELGLARADVAAGLRWGRNAALVVVAVVAVGVLVRDLVLLVDALLSDRRARLGGGELAWAALVRIPVGTALFEELAFRGVLLGLLLQVTSPAWAVTWSSIVFGLWHIPPALVTLRINEVPAGSSAGLGALAGAVAVTTVAGVLFCALRLVSASLVAPVLGHWATNGVGLLAAALTDHHEGTAPEGDH